MNEPTLFTRIITGEIPSHKVYEDDKTYAFLDIHPIQPGHVLVVPKTPVEFVWDLSEEDYQAVMKTSHKIARRLREAFPDKTRVAMHIEGLDVAHAHIKLFPFSTHEEFVRHPDMDSEPDHEALAAIADRIRF